MPPLGRSDHALIVSNFVTAELHREPSTSRTVWRYDQADWGRLKAYFRDLNWSSTLSDDPEECCILLTAVIQKGMDQFIPSKTYTVRSVDPTW